MSYKIASFNMQKFSANTEKDLDKIARMIEGEKICIMAIQEIFSKKALDNLLAELNRFGKYWDGRWDTPNSRSISAAEGYAFIWDTRVIGLTTNIQGKAFEPRILNQYKMDRNTFDELMLDHGRDANSTIQRKLIRNPYYGRFSPINKPGGSYFEFRLINAHIMYSNSVNSEIYEDKSDTSDVLMRKNEYNLLSKVVYPKVFNKDLDYILGQKDAKYMPAYTLLMGDYNLNLGSKYPYIEQPLIEINDGVTYPGNSEGVKKILTTQEQMTTLISGDKLKNLSNDQDVAIAASFNIDECVHANNYDHFTYDTKSFESLKINNIYRVDCDKYMYQSNSETNQFEPYIQYRKKISDHLPIIIDVEINREY